MHYILVENFSFQFENPIFKFYPSPFSGNTNESTEIWEVMIVAPQKKIFFLCLQLQIAGTQI